ncbi:MAG TPA: response regulator [Pyrinomonadaceae bacterium]
MITGRKLLLADDSIAIQKVIDLTFTDEGMEVTTVDNGQDALEQLNQCRPDVVLADVFMPNVDGYALCRYIKENKRFQDVPVMLLVGSFEPFDEAEAKRAGADDVVTKPFQSIRDLVNRVGSLVSHEDDARQEAADKHSVLGLNETDEKPADETAVAEGAESAEQASVRVFVEAPSMEPDATVLVEAPLMEVEPGAVTEHTGPPVIDLQTADTKKLEPISTEATTERETIELQVAEEDNVPEALEFDDGGVLDLGDIDSCAAASSEDDFVLDVELEPVTISAAPTEPASEQTLAESVHPALAESVHPAIAEFAEAHEPAFEEVKEPVLTRVTDEPADEVSTAPLLELSPTRGLSSDEIEAISRRVVEQMSDKVVREIAWEVVPELSELLIKRRLEESR